MSRVANYTIEGFLYQFNKTLLEILNSTDDTEVTVEGVIEDIDMKSPSGAKAIQCKYHGTQQNFSLSVIYKPVLQMMEHFARNTTLDIKYRLYAYFPNQKESRTLTQAELDSILETQNPDLQKYVNAVKGNINTNDFSKKFSLEFGKSLEELTKDVCKAFSLAGLPEHDIEMLIYPNAIHEIANLSTKHNENERKTKRPVLLNRLQQIRTTTISRWTLALKTYKEILKTKRHQLKSNLDKNSRLRYLIIAQDTVGDFRENSVNFVQEYLEKYHFKQAHIKTPIFCLDCEESLFDDIRSRLYNKGIVVADGYVGKNFVRKHFLREPIVSKQKGGDLKIEFSLRLIRFENDKTILNEQVCDDLFIVGNKNYEEINSTDVNIERFGVTKFQELKFMLGMSDSHE